MTEQQILQRLACLEAVNDIRHCLNRYMEICDALNAQTNLAELMALFRHDAIWEGIGERYRQTFGRLEGATQIANMFQSYMQKDAYFSMNAHFVNSEQIHVSGSEAVGKWMMLQTSAFQSGGAHLTSAKLWIDFSQELDGRWVISHFRTENIFSRRVTAWSDQLDMPVPTETTE